MDEGEPEMATDFRPPTTKPGSPAVSPRRIASVRTLYALTALTVVGAALFAIDFFHTFSLASPPTPGGDSSGASCWER